MLSDTKLNAPSIPPRQLAYPIFTGDDWADQALAEQRERLGERRYRSLLWGNRGGRVSARAVWAEVSQ